MSTIIPQRSDFHHNWCGYCANPISTSKCDKCGHVQKTYILQNNAIPRKLKWYTYTSIFSPIIVWMIIIVIPLIKGWNELIHTRVYTWIILILCSILLFLEGLYNLNRIEMIREKGYFECHRCKTNLAPDTRYCINCRNNVKHYIW